MALSIFYYSLKYIEKKDFKRYLLCNIIGALFHNSAIIFIPLYFILGKRYKLKFKILILCAISFLLPEILTIVNKILLSTKYSMYLTNGAYNPLAGIQISTIINIIIFIYFEILYSTNRKNEQDTRFNIYDNLHYIGIIISLLLSKVPLAIRIFIYFRYVEFLSVPYLIEKTKIKNSYKEILIFIIIIIYFIYFWHGVYIENGNNVLPYKSCLFK